MPSFKIQLGLATLLAGAIAGVSADSSPAKSLKVGDPAPKLQNGKWIQGEAVKEFSSNNVYLVEFWATWCGPCKVAIPHLNEIQQKFKNQGIVVIGQNVWETSEAAVAPFVKRMGDQMTYRVALDDKSGGGKGFMSDNWMLPAGQSGIPVSFLVDKQGRIAWIGHPMELRESYLEQVLAGKHDTKPVAAAAEKRSERRLQVAAQANEINPHLKKLTSQIGAGQWAEAEVTVKRIEELAADLPEGERARLLFQRLRLLVAKEDFDAASDHATTKMKVESGDVVMQANVARLLAESPKVKGAALTLAAKLAESGYTKGGQNAAWFDTTLARIKFIQGEKEKAIELQTESLKRAEDAKPVFKNRLQSDLDSYKAGKLPAKG